MPAPKLTLVSQSDAAVASTRREVRLLRSWLERNEVLQAQRLLDAMGSDAQTAWYHRHGVTLRFDGYAHDPRPLWTVHEARRFVAALTRRVPWWLHLLDPAAPDGAVLWLAHLLPLAGSIPQTRSAAQLVAEYPNAAVRASLLKGAFEAVGEFHRTVRLPASRSKAVLAEIGRHFREAST